jgi:hypothetical protein
LVNKVKTPKLLRRLVRNRKATAEVIGSVMFVVIVMFFFSGVYLWHDNATKSMNNLLSDKLNSAIQVSWLIDENDVEQDTLVVTNTGGVGASLSRLWIVTSNAPTARHLFASFEDLGGNGLYLGAGNTLTIALTGGSLPSGSEIFASATSTGANVPYTRTKATGETFTVLTSLGNMAAPEGLIKIVTPITGGGSGSAPVGSVIVADFETFSYYPVTGSQNPNYAININNPLNAYFIDSKGENVAFSLVLTNNDPSHRTVNLNAYSQMFFINTKNPNNVGYIIFCAAKVDASGKILQDFSGSIDLPYNVPTKVYFASKEAIVSPTLFAPSTLKTSGQVDQGAYPLNLALLGKYDNTISFGQNIPFVSIYITS